MKLIWCCLLAAFVAVSLAAIDVEKTVRQVQSILKANQQLPRLTRDEILQLLNDIKSEDSKSSSIIEPGEEDDVEKIPAQYSSIVNEINPPLPNTLDNIVGEDNEIPISTLTPANTNLLTTEYDIPIRTSDPPKSDENPEKVISLKRLYFGPPAERTTTTAPVDVIETTTNSQPTLTVVLPYTPRDGSSLQELYTRPPRVEVVHVSTTTATPKTSRLLNKNTSNKKDNSELTTELINHFPDELQSFLEAHGLTGKPGEDHFLLPLEGFKPLPPVKVVDSSVQLPENILLTYDLVAPSNNANTKSYDSFSSTNNIFLYAPLRPELPYELDSSASEIKRISLPYDMSSKNPKLMSEPNYDPIDYDSIKVIPLSKGINPNTEPVNSSNEQTKRQASIEESTTEAQKELASSTTTEEPKTNVVSDLMSTEIDKGASISDLEESFGGAAPSQPGGSELPPPKKNGFYWMLDWNSFLEVGDGDTKVNIRFEPKLGDPQMFLPVTVP